MKYILCPIIKYFVCIVIIFLLLHSLHIDTKLNMLYLASVIAIIFMVFDYLFIHEHESLFGSLYIDDDKDDDVDEDKEHYKETPRVETIITNVDVDGNEYEDVYDESMGNNDDDYEDNVNDVNMVLDNFYKSDFE